MSVEIDQVEALESVAVVGMSGRFPAAGSVDQLWQNLVNEVDGLTWFEDDELEALGIPPSLFKRENFVPRGSIIEGYDRFDASLFGIRPKEAQTTDPQSRMFLQVCHEALEHAGYAPFETTVDVGVFAGCNPIDYSVLLGAPDLTDSLTAFDQLVGNERDYLATRVSHRLNLTGPAMNLQTACSTSLVAVHVAAQHLLNYECSMALAGGVALNFRQGVGYFYQPGMILSPDGYCRAFDKKANGTTLGQGAGVVVLKRLSDALTDRDTIHAVLTGSAVNNDGSDKVSYTAPSLKGQAGVIASAQAIAGLKPCDITYIEAHGTGTNLGDPIEVAALNMAFPHDAKRGGYCSIGSVKTSLGHLDAAAGIAGFIKAVLAVREGVIPRSLHFDTANDEIDFASSPFRVAAETHAWSPITTDLRRAGISSFGIGGTNVHAIVEEPPPTIEAIRQERPLVVVASGSSAHAASATMDRVSSWSEEGKLTPATIATLREGRSHSTFREAATVDAAGRFVGKRWAAKAQGNRPQVWMFSGQGAQFPGMARGLYGKQEVFTTTFDRLFAQFADWIEPELHALLTRRADKTAEHKLRQTRITQPALFALQYAFGKQLIACGLEPRALLGHSIGEFAAATLAGVMSEADGCRVVVARGRLMQEMEPGGMISTRLDEAVLKDLLPNGAEIAAINSTNATVAAGPFEALEALERDLHAAGHAYTRLNTSHGFHSATMAPAAAAFEDVLASVSLSAPRMAMLSGKTGGWLTDNDAVNPKFWAQQIREPVLFADCVRQLADEDNVYIELGPGRALSAFVHGHDAFKARPTTVAALTAPKSEADDEKDVTFDLAARLWTEGMDIDLTKFDALTASRRVPAPLTAFQNDESWAPQYRHQLALDNTTGSPDRADASPTVLPLDDWCYERSWRRTSKAAVLAERVLVLSANLPRAQAVTKNLATHADIVVAYLDTTCQLETTPFTVRPANDEDLNGLIAQLTERNWIPDRVVHLWLADAQTDRLTLRGTHQQLDLGVNTLLSLARALGSLSMTHRTMIDVVVAGAFDVLGEESVIPSSAAASGATKVIPLEFSGLDARLIDVPVVPADVDAGALAGAVLTDIGDDPVIALRGRTLWAHSVSPVRITEPTSTPLRENGAYLIIGGFGGVGLSIAQYLAEHWHARIALTGRSGEPDKTATDEETVRRRSRLEDIARAADDLIILTADATDPEQVARMFSMVESRFGKVHGVIYAAAVVDDAGSIRSRDIVNAHPTVSAKIDGAVVLADALHERHVDFVMLSSSMSSQLYHNRFGQVGYVTSNAFIEAFAETGALNADRVVTVAWDDWLDIGMSVRAERRFADQHGQSVQLMDPVHSFTPPQGVEIFRRALVAKQPTLFVSTTRLDHRIENDRQAKSPFLEQAAASDAAVQVEGTSVESMVRNVWTLLLGIDDFDVDDNFFDLGGDSLQAARMAALMSRHLEQQVPLDLIFESDSLAALISELEILPRANGGQEAETHEEAPLNPSQRRFLERGCIHPSHFNVVSLLTPREPVGEARWKSAVESLICRHDALRTRFTTTSPDTAQQIVNATGADTALIEILSGVSTENLVDTVDAYHYGLDLVEGPLAQFIYIGLVGGEERFLINVHHLVIDHVSLVTLIDELDHELSVAEDKRPLPTPVPYSALGRHLREFVLADRSSPTELWLERLTNPHTPLALPRGATLLNKDAAARIMHFSAADTKSLLASGSQVQERFLVMLAAALRAWLNQPDAHVAIDVMGHGRRHLPYLEVGQTIGFFISYSPVWVDPSDPVDAQIRRAAADLETAWLFDALRFADSDRAPQRGSPQVLFNYIGRTIDIADSNVLDIAPESTGSHTHPDNYRDHALAFRASLTDDGTLELAAIYDTGQFVSVDLDGLEMAILEAISFLPNRDG